MFVVTNLNNYHPPPTLFTSGLEKPQNRLLELLGGGDSSPHFPPWRRHWVQVVADIDVGLHYLKGINPC